MQKVASVKGQRKTERKGQQTKFSTVNGKKKKKSPNFDLCACPFLLNFVPNPRKISPFSKKKKLF